MDLKITGKRLDNHLSYDWWKYFAILLASIFLWNLLFTMLSPRLASAKKMEIFFIVNGYSYDGADNLQKSLKDYLSGDITEFHLNNYTPDDQVTSQVLTAKVSVREGDLFVMPYSATPANDMFGIYVDNRLFTDFETLIAGALEFGNNPMDYEEYKNFVREKFRGDRQYNKEERIQKEYNIYKDACDRAKEYAGKLQGYINDYADLETENPLFYKYKKFTSIKSLNPDVNVTIEDEKIWGLNFNALVNITNLTKGGFLNAVKVGDRFLPLNYAMGITAFKEDNFPLYYENLAVINYLIENYYIGSV